MDQELSVAELAIELETRRILLLDVRDGEDVAVGHIPGAWPVSLAALPLRLRDLDDPLHHKLGTVRARVALVAGDEDRLLVARAMLAEVGVDALAVAGGVAAWSRAGRPLNRGAH
ncbi:rhodanese-like domain-containing protein [Actinomycetospora flava]|uniref:Rhodanese-like domain-containing protein n=1 Tax=Actinomycetospora flava TaxID=3129232 RepID=A0ABU8M8W7_9PSEU